MIPSKCCKICHILSFVKKIKLQDEYDNKLCTYKNIFKKETYKTI